MSGIGGESKGKRQRHTHWEGEVSRWSTCLSVLKKLDKCPSLVRIDLYERSCAGVSGSGDCLGSS